MAIVPKIGPPGAEPAEDPVRADVERDLSLPLRIGAHHASEVGRQHRYQALPRVVHPPGG